MKKLRILCLHGYHGNAAILREQTRSLTRGLGTWADFHYVDAPSLAAGDFGWWHAIRQTSSSATGDPGVGSSNARYEGWYSTLEWVLGTFDREGPFDGVFGFSQGAALTALLVGLRSRDPMLTTHKPLVFSFAIMVGGFWAGDPALARLYQAKQNYEIPSVHIIGRSDLIVPSQNSRSIANLFRDPLVLEHDGGHVVASTPEIREKVSEFLRRQAGVAAQDAASRPAAANQPGEISLWPSRSRPSMQLSFPTGGDSRPRAAMLVFRGGGYASSSGSGAGSAQWAAEHGMVGIEVEYRTDQMKEYFPANYADAARAVRLVRQHAVEWNIDPNRVGVMGYSAGGHLASLLSTQPNLWRAPEDDLAGKISARPDLVVLAYPLISFLDGYSPGAFAGSVDNFLGDAGKGEARRREFSNELHVEGSHPPVFIWTTRDDGIVPYTHAQLFAEACRREGVPVVFKLYPHGPHGLGLARNQDSEVAHWTDELLKWLAQQGFVSAQ
jgi:acetyl esterase/lipase